MDDYRDGARLMAIWLWDMDLDMANKPLREEGRLEISKCRITPRTL